MSKKFGLNWKDYDFERMDKFVQVAQWEAERQNKASKGQQAGKKKFR